MPGNRAETARLFLPQLLISAIRLFLICPHLCRVSNRQNLTDGVNGRQFGVGTLDLRQCFFDGTS